MKSSRTSFKYKKNKWVIEKKIGNQVFILDPTAGNIHTLNETAGFIWMKLTQGKIEEEICRLLVASYNVSLVNARKDVKAFIASYLERGIIYKKRS